LRKSVNKSEGVCRMNRMHVPRRKAATTAGVQGGRVNHHATATALRPEPKNY